MHYGVVDYSCSRPLPRLPREVYYSSNSTWYAWRCNCLPDCVPHPPIAWAPLLFYLLLGHSANQAGAQGKEGEVCGAGVVWGGAVASGRSPALS